MFERSSSLAKPSSNRAFGDGVELGERRATQLLPVIQLEQDLVVDRQVSKRLEQNPIPLAAGDDGRATHEQIGDRRHAKVELVELARSGPVVMKQHVASHAEHEGREPGVIAELVAMLETGQHRLLDQIVDLVADLVLEEAREPSVVPVEQPRARAIVTLAPGCQQLGVRSHDGAYPG